MEQTFIILKPSTINRSLVGDVITRFQRKGLIIAGIKMMQLDEKSFENIMLTLSTVPSSLPW